MNAVKYLDDYVRTIDPHITDFFRKERVESSKIDPLAVDVINTLENFLQGGKKIRGTLTVLGYQCVGGKDRKNILPISLAVELMHSSLLIHDDFIDNDLFRRGKPTVHTIYSQKHTSHYGASISLMIGDVGFFLSHKLFAQSKFDPNTVQKALLKYEEFLINTGYGEVMDIAFDFKKDVTWEDVAKVRIYKTAYYTFALPLTLGAILGGADKGQLDAIMKYSEPVGIAFQIRDDILGIYGDSKVTGKSSDSDIREGKKTLLYSKAIDNGNVSERDFLKRWYGNKLIDLKKIEKIKKIIIETKSLEECQMMAADLVTKGKKSTDKITNIDKYRKVLNGLADYIVGRDK